MNADPRLSQSRAYVSPASSRRSALSRSTASIPLRDDALGPNAFTPLTIERGDPVQGRFGHYQVRLASCDQDRAEASRLRFRVFNLELGEGLDSSYATGLDTDPFDAVCDHLLVEDRLGQVVGTYRMQSGLAALMNCGYYSEQEFDLAPFEHIRGRILELGRACIDRSHRSSEVLTLLWRGIAQYARLFGLRYLVGCSSLSTQSPEIGWAVYRRIAESSLSRNPFGHNRAGPMRFHSR